MNHNISLTLSNKLFINTNISWLSIMFYPMLMAKPCIVLHKICSSLALTVLSLSRIYEFLFIYYIQLYPHTFKTSTNEIAEAPSKSKGRDKRLRRPCFPLVLLLYVN